MSNKIQIKRSATNAVIPTLSNGELAFTQASNTLFIGAPDGSGNIPIGTKLNYGTLTANQVLVANSSSGINRISTSNLEVGVILTDGSNSGSSGYVLTSNGTSNAFWQSLGDLSTNVDAQYTWTNTQTFSNTITFNSTINGTANNALYLNGVAASGYQTTAGLSSNVAGLTANNTSYVGTIAAANVVSNATLQTNLANYAALGGATFTGAVVVSNNLTVTGNLTLSGNTVIVGANNLVVSDAVISLHTQSNLAPWTSNDGRLIGTAYHYYSSVDSQALLAFDPSNKRLTFWANSTDAAAGDPAGTELGTIQANTLYVGNSVTYTTVNATSFTGTANNTLFVGSTAAANVVSNATLQANLSNYINSSANYTITGVHTHSGNIVLSATTATGSVLKSANSTAIVVLGANVDGSSAMGGSFSAIANSIVISPNFLGGGTNKVAFGPSIALGDPGPNGPGGERQYAPQGTGESTSQSLFFANTTQLQLGNSTSYFDVTNTVTLVNSGNTFSTNGSFVSVGNATVYSTINNTSYSGTANNALFIGGVAAANVVSNATLQANLSSYINTSGSYTLTGNNTLNGTNTVFGSNVIFNGGVTSNFIPTANNTYSLGNSTNRWSSLYVSGSTIYIGNVTISVDSSNNLVFGTTGGVITANNVAFNTANIGVVSANSGGVINVSSNAVFAGNNFTFSNSTANISATNAVLNVRDVNISGNLAVSGTITTIDATNLTVKDSTIKLADQQANSTSYTDSIDIGVYGTYGNTANTWFAGINRDHNDGVWKLFYSNTEPSTVVDSAAAGYSRGTLQAYLQPYGAGGAFVANSTVVNITANSTVSSALVANSLTLTTALSGVYGGTGKKTITNQAILVGNTTNGYNELTVGTTGYVLQSNGSALVYDILDGGTF